MFGKRKISRGGETAEAVVLGADMSGPMGAFMVGDVVPVRYLAERRGKVEVDRDAMVAAKQAGRKEAEEGLIRLGEERLERDVRRPRRRPRHR
ncbi:MAG TPA: hypothetical protein VGC32_16880 [Solirubrobacterales bacterium]